MDCDTHMCDKNVIICVLVIIWPPRSRIYTYQTNFLGVYGKFSCLMKLIYKSTRIGNLGNREQSGEI